MNYPIPDPDGSAVIELDRRISVCTVPGCGGTVVRHSLGSGQSVDRCIRCFRRYQARLQHAAEWRGRFRRVIDEIVGWRE